MIVCPETPALCSRIRVLLCEAFPTPAEADLVERLRGDGDVAVALAALEDEVVVGHVVLSRMVAPMRALGLGPVAVQPARQRQGVGRLLVNAALERARTDDWEAVFVLGDPAYYARFGFCVEAVSGFDSPFSGPHFMGLGLQNREIAPATGRVAYPRAFQDLA